MPRRALPWTLEAWTASAAAGGTRVAFIAVAGGRAVRNVRLTRALESGRSQLTFTVAPEYHAHAALAPRARVLRLTRTVPTGPESTTTEVLEFRVTRRSRRVERTLGAYDVVATPLAELLLELDLFRETSRGGFATWRYSCTDRTPTEVLTDVRDRLHALGYTWIAVGTVAPTTPVSFTLDRTATPQTIVQALIDALAAKDVAAEFRCALASDLSAYRLELVTAIASELGALPLSSDGVGRTLVYDEDELDQASTIIPFGAEGIDLRDFQCEVDAVDGGTGWVDLVAIGGFAAPLVAVADQLNGKRLFRELTGRSLAILDSRVSPPGVQLATADLASGLAAGERVSFRESDDESGERIVGTGFYRIHPVQVVSTATSPNRIRTRRHPFSGDSSPDWLGVANQLRDWTAERSQWVQSISGTYTIDPVGRTIVFGSAPTTAPQTGDWFYSSILSFEFGSQLVGYPLTVTGYNAGTLTATWTPRYSFAQVDETTLDDQYILEHFRPVGTPMRILSTAVTDNELTVDALTGPTFADTDVLELRQRCQGVRLVELTDPAALAAMGRKVASVDVPSCTGATNLVPNADLAAWAGASTDPPDGFSVASVVGTVTRTRETAPEFTRYGGKSWKLVFAAGASAEVFTPVFPINRVPGAEEISVAVALLFERFSGNVTLQVAVYRVDVDGTRTALLDGDGEPLVLAITPPDTTADVPDALKPAINAWYDAVLTNVSIAALQADRLQIGVTRPAGGSNPALAVYLDAFACLQRPGLPQAPEGGVRWIFGSDALAMVAAGHQALLARAPLRIRIEGRVLDVFRLAADRYAPWELVLGRTIALTIAPLGVTDTVRLVELTEDLDVPGDAVVTLETPRPDLTRLLADQIRPRVTSTLPSLVDPFASALARLSAAAERAG